MPGGVNEATIAMRYLDSVSCEIACFAEKGIDSIQTDAVICARLTIHFFGELYCWMFVDRLFSNKLSAVG